MGDYRLDAARQHEYSDLAREALEAVNAREHTLPDMYGICAEPHLGFQNDEPWGTAKVALVHQPTLRFCLLARANREDGGQLSPRHREGSHHVGHGKSIIQESG